MATENILLIDTCLPTVSISFETGGKIFTRQKVAERNLASFLTAMIEGVCADARQRVQDITKIAVLTGTGSFTGIRMGIAAAKGLAVGLDIPLVGVSVFDVWHHHYIDKNWLAVLNAGSGEYYVATNLNTQLDVRDKPLLRDQIFGKNFDLYLGDGIEDVLSIDAVQQWITPEQMLNAVSNKSEQFYPATPFYIKGHYAEKQKDQATSCS